MFDQFTQNSIDNICQICRRRVRYGKETWCQAMITSHSSASLEISWPGPPGSGTLSLHFLFTFPSLSFSFPSLSLHFLLTFPSPSLHFPSTSPSISLYFPLLSFHFTVSCIDYFTFLSITRDLLAWSSGLRYTFPFLPHHFPFTFFQLFL